MDVEAAAEFHDWEVVPDSDDTGSVQNTSNLEGIERDSEGIIRADYFAIDSHTKYAATQDEDVTDDVSVQSDNPSWIDPVCETRYSITTGIGDLWSSDGSDDGKCSEFGYKNNELNIVDTEKRKGGYDANGAVEIDTSLQLWSASGGIEEKTDMGGYGEHIKTHEDSEPSREENIVEERGDNEDVVIEAMKPGGEEMYRGPVWWKLPLDLLKYCLSRVSPVWTISMAAAMLGVVILGRRLYKLKRKSRTLQLKVTVDDKKVSQFMSGAARLNEAFSVVKRVPIIRPSFPAAGVAPWPPVMTLR